MKTRDDASKVPNNIQAYEKEVARQAKLIGVLLKRESLIVSETFDNENEMSLAIRIQRIILSHSDNGSRELDPR
ncbi:MAG: hypothetical protein IH857_08775 [Deltaproteobacteria bacterium]|nr:hypothetical protein [Deltaproteobacteria bacterium]MCZ6626472.1 hypothetical protein [Deltaproteobacteria bacterium]